jgi:hypothetical protein
VSELDEANLDVLTMLDDRPRVHTSFERAFYV